MLRSIHPKGLRSIHAPNLTRLMLLRREAAKDHTYANASRPYIHLSYIHSKLSKASERGAYDEEVSRLSKYEFTSILPTIPERARHLILKKKAKICVLTSGCDGGAKPR